MKIGIYPIIYRICKVGIYTTCIVGGFGVIVFYILVRKFMKAQKELKEHDEKFECFLKTCNLTNFEELKNDKYRNKSARLVVAWAKKHGLMETFNFTFKFYAKLIIEDYENERRQKENK